MMAEIAPLIHPRGSTSPERARASGGAHARLPQGENLRAPMINRGGLFGKCGWSQLIDAIVGFGSLRCK